MGRGMGESEEESEEERDGDGEGRRGGVKGGETGGDDSGDGGSPCGASWALARCRLVSRERGIDGVFRGGSLSAVIYKNVSVTWQLVNGFFGGQWTVDGETVLSLMGTEAKRNQKDVDPLITVDGAMQRWYKKELLWRNYSALRLSAALRDATSEKRWL
ncbi:hypothetical protein B0H12DRAFT_1069261 [Mycena haematopus]|nr:hypothetical protein B0H12DRAFT_1069261 [Mycena haematopus]